MKTYDYKIAEKLAAKENSTFKRLGIRFDRVGVRLLAKLRAHIESEYQVGFLILLTMTAPIKTPSKTVRALQIILDQKIKDKKFKHDLGVIIHGNHVRIRILKISNQKKSRLAGLIHNSNVNSKNLLDKILRL